MNTAPHATAAAAGEKATPLSVRIVGRAARLGAVVAVVACSWVGPALHGSNAADATETSPGAATTETTGTATGTAGGPPIDHGSIADAAHPAAMTNSTDRTDSTRGGVAAERRDGAEVVVLAQAASLDVVFTNLRNWIMGMFAGVTLVCWSVAGLRYTLSQGDPGEIERAKAAFRAGAYGFALTALAPLGVQILRGIVGV